MDEFSVCFTDPLMVDMILYNEWLVGTSEQDSAKRLAVSCMDTVGDIPFTILVQEVREQYTLFQSLENFLRSPSLLNSPMLASLSPKIKEELIAGYYQFDTVVMREILGKRMSTKLRKDMDDVAEKTGISLCSCLRQFDNVKTILKSYEDMEKGLHDVLTKHYMFSETLVKKYYPLILVFIIRFETTKKRMSYLTFEDIISCTEFISESWMFSDSHLGADKSTDMDEIDRHFVQELRDLRSIVIDKDFQDIHKTLILNRLEQLQSCTLHFTKSVEANFKTISRNLFTLGAGLSQSKDFRDFFNDVVEKLIEPIKQLDWSLKELDVFLTAIINSWGDFKDDGQQIRRFDAIYIRFMEVMKKCMLQMYRSYTS